MGKSTIEWTKETWNPVTGCTKISAGCKFCYAETFAERWRGVPGHAYEQGFDLKIWRDRLAMPLRMKTPTTMFTNSMSDLFHEDVPYAFIVDIFAAMALSSQYRKWGSVQGHTFQVLTKRAERMLRTVAYPKFPLDVADAMLRLAQEFPGLRSTKGSWPDSIAGEVRRKAPQIWPIPGVWLGVSVESPDHLKRLDALMETPAAVRWASFEPLLEGLGALTRWLSGTPRLDWGVVGGESGPGARPFDVAWARDILAQFRAAGEPLFVKQMGKLFAMRQTDWGTARRKDRKGGVMAEWPAELRVREFPRGDMA